MNYNGSRKLKIKASEFDENAHNLFSKEIGNLYFHSRFLVRDRPRAYQLEVKDDLDRILKL